MSDKNAVVIDDDHDVLSVISEIVELTGFSVKRFQCPVEALRYLQSHCADVVLTDYRMPGMNGLELAERIRKLDTTVPIIMLTGDADLARMDQRAADRGVSDILCKPIDCAKLDARMKSFL